MLPHNLLNNPDYQCLTLASRLVLDLLMLQHDGTNNGDLSATLGDFKKLGKTSNDTLIRGLKELQLKNLIIRTREPETLGKNRVCALYAMTWLPTQWRNGRRVHEKSSRDMTPSLHRPESGLRRESFTDRNAASYKPEIGLDGDGFSDRNPALGGSFRDRNPDSTADHRPESGLLYTFTAPDLDSDFLFEEQSPNQENASLNDWQEYEQFMATKSPIENQPGTTQKLSSLSSQATNLSDALYLDSRLRSGVSQYQAGSSRSQGVG